MSQSERETQDFPSRNAQYVHTATFIQEGLAEGRMKLRFNVPIQPASQPEPILLRREKSRDVSKSKNPAYRQVSFWIPRELHEAVKIRLIEEGDRSRDQSDLFADALRSYLAGVERRQG